MKGVKLKNKIKDCLAELVEVFPKRVPFDRWNILIISGLRVTFKSDLSLAACQAEAQIKEIFKFFWMTRGENYASLNISKSMPKYTCH